MILIKMARVLFDPNISKEKLNELPLKNYQGPIAVIHTQEQLRAALSEIRRFKTVGFDTETKPSFRKGEFHHVAMVQIAVPKKVYLLRLNQLGLRNEIARFFENEAVKKVGVSIRDDLIALRTLKEFEPVGFVDLHDVVKGIGIESEGLRRITGTILGFRISKSQQTSNWEKAELKKNQITYAATDAWCCLEIYTKLVNQGYIET